MYVCLRLDSCTFWSWAHWKRGPRPKAIGGLALPGPLAVGRVASAARGTPGSPGVQEVQISTFQSRSYGPLVGPPRSESL